MPHLASKEAIGRRGSRLEYTIDDHEITDSQSLTIMIVNMPWKADLKIYDGNGDANDDD